MSNMELVVLKHLLNDEDYARRTLYIGNLVIEEEEDREWLIEKTEKFCQEKAIYNAIMESIGIIDGEDKGKDKGSIPEILADALSVSFDPHIGHDFIDDS